ncbi:MAG: hypothetical protein NZ866_02065 [Patescibacteria group bacterium]|nr:hypothetical protein [Patescibacteria group bacterium]
MPIKNIISSLKFSEVFSINYPPYRDDWIYFYMNSDMRDFPNFTHALIIYHHDPYYKFLEYLFPSDFLFEEKIGNEGSFRFKNRDPDKLSRGSHFNFDHIIKKLTTFPPQHFGKLIVI